MGDHRITSKGPTGIRRALLLGGLIVATPILLALGLVGGLLFGVAAIIFPVILDWVVTAAVAAGAVAIWRYLAQPRNAAPEVEGAQFFLASLRDALVASRICAPDPEGELDAQLAVLFPSVAYGDRRTALVGLIEDVCTALGGVERGWLAPESFRGPTAEVLSHYPCAMVRCSAVGLGEYRLTLELGRAEIWPQVSGVIHALPLPGGVATIACVEELQATAPQW